MWGSCSAEHLSNQLQNTPRSLRGGLGFVAFGLTSFYSHTLDNAHVSSFPSSWNTLEFALLRKTLNMSDHPKRTDHTGPCKS